MMINNQVCVSGKDVAGFMHINGKEISLYVGDKVRLGNSNIVATIYADEESFHKDRYTEHFMESFDRGVVSSYWWFGCRVVSDCSASWAAYPKK